MTLILIAHWLVVIVGIFCTQFAIAYPSPNQYNQNHYQIPQYERKNLRDKDTPLKNSLTSDLIIRKQMTERQPPLQATINKEIYQYLKKNVSFNDNDNLSIVYKTKTKNDWIDDNFTKLNDSNKFLDDNIKKILNIQIYKLFNLNLENNLQKRSNFLLKNVLLKKEEKNEENIVSAISLQELLKQWGIDTLNEKPSIHSQRGDIEVTEVIPSKSDNFLVRGDVPALLIFNNESVVRPQEQKRNIINTGRKLLWANEIPQIDTWDFSKIDGLHSNKEANYESGEPYKKEKREYIQRNNYRNYQYSKNNDIYNDNSIEKIREKQRIAEEKRIEWEENEQRRDEERRRRIDEEQRLNDEEQRRNDEKQRRNDEKQRRNDEERRRNNEKQERLEEEKRRNEEEQQRIDDVQKQYYENLKMNNEKQRLHNKKYDRSNEEQHINNKEQSRNYEKLQHKERAIQLIINTPDTYDARIREWQHMKDNYDRLIRDKENNKNQMNNEKSLQELTNEKKLQDYIRRNTPIIINNRVNNSRIQPAENLTILEEGKFENLTYRKRIDEEKRHNGLQLSQYEQEMRRRQELYEGRREEEKQLHKSSNKVVINRDEEDEEIDENWNKNQSINNEEIAREIEDIRRIEQRKRLMEEQNNLNKEQKSPLEQSESNERPRQHITTQNHGYDDFQQYILPNEHVKKGNENIREKYFQSNNRYNQSQINDHELLEYPHVRYPEEMVSVAPWAEKSESEKPVEIDNRKIEVEWNNVEKERRKQNNALDTITELSKSRDHIERKFGQTNNVKIKEWSPLSEQISKENSKSQLQEYRRKENETKGRYHELKQNKNGQFQSLTESQRNEEERLRRLPISATIVVRNISRNNINYNIPTEIGFRGNFDDSNIAFPGINPFNKGIEVPESQQIPTTRRPSNQSPNPCVWSIVICCSQLNANNTNRLRQCFEATNCPGANWDIDRCSQQKVKSANKEIMRFYLKNQKPDSPTTIIF